MTAKLQILEKDGAVVGELPQLSDAELLELYQHMLRIRVLDGRMLKLQRAGRIGFVGIIVPHIVRLVFGTGHRVLIPLSILFGGAFMVVADLLARTVAAPAELPIGVVTAFLGAPFFVLVLRTSRREVW